MKVIVLAHSSPCHYVPLGIYSFDGFQKFLTYMAKTNQAYSTITLFVVEYDQNLMDFGNSIWKSNDYKCTVSVQHYYVGGWCLYKDRDYSHEKFMKEIETLMRYEDSKVKQLEAELAACKTRIEYLETHIRYMPGGEGATEAKEHFESLAEKAEHLN